MKAAAKNNLPGNKRKTFAATTTTNCWVFSGILLTGGLLSWLGTDQLPSDTLQTLSLASAFAAVLYLISIRYGKQIWHPIILTTIKNILKLRYSTRIIGLEKICPEAQKSILFLPNHPAMIDPVILMAILHKNFTPRPLADQDQVNRPLLRSAMESLNAIILPNIFKNGRQSRDRINDVLSQCVDSLKNGDNLLLYPAGKLSRSAREDIGGNSAVEFILDKIPEQRLVLVRTSGLWGSSFSWASGKAPGSGSELKKLITFALANLVFWGPRREITVEFKECSNFPRHAGRLGINRFMESFYNETTSAASRVPRYWWQGNKPELMPDPDSHNSNRNLANIPQRIQTQVIGYLEELAGVNGINQKDRLDRDLGIDSLSLMELAQWLETEFGFPQDDFSSLNTVGACILAANGEGNANQKPRQDKIAAHWFASSDPTQLQLPEGSTIAELFLKQAAASPDKAILADRISGVKTYRDLVTAILVLKPFLEKLPEKNIGIMLPASLSASLAYLAVIFSGKVPVMVNWTVGSRHLQHCLQEAEVKHVVTAAALLDKLEDQGMDLAGLSLKWLKLDQLKNEITLATKLTALVKSRFLGKTLRQTKVAATAAILFTSGSEANPKAVPLSHQNILANIRDFSAMLSFREDDRLLGILPPFHSLGLVGTCLMPLCMGLKTVYHSNPTEGAILAEMTADYQATLLIGTPTFLQGALRSASGTQLSTLRLAFTGAEKCPAHVYDAFNRSCPEAVLCEGYGITECSPVVSVNQLESPQPGTIGKILPTMEHKLVDPDSYGNIETGRRGLLLLRGPNVFSGYLHNNPNSAAPSSPFIILDGKKWYNTGDLVKQDESETLTFCGRLKRFVKLGGEMISLPAIEAILHKKYPGEAENGPTLAVEATPSQERPELVLFSTLEIDRQEVNQAIRTAGLSALHNIKQLIQVENIPVLGTGKTDYQQLKAVL